MVPISSNKQLFVRCKPLFFWLLLFLLFLLFFECFLRLGGMMFLYIQERENRRSLMQQGMCRILCIGESTTAVGGEYSYPRQLEGMLNAYSQDMKFDVINKGVPGAKTTYLVDKLEQQIKEYRPHIVVVMMGINDSHSLPPGSSSCLQKAYRTLTSLRVCNLTRWLVHSFRQRLDFERMRKGVASSRDVDEKENLLKGIDIAPDEEAGAYHQYIREGEKLLEQRKYQEAKEASQKAVAINPQGTRAYQLLALASHLELNIDDAIKMIEKALALDPDIYTFLCAASIYSSQAAKLVDSHQQEAAAVFSKKEEIVCLKMIEEYSTNPVGYVRTADFYIKKQELKKAHEVYVEALRVGAISERVLGGMAMVKLFLKDIEGALEFYQRAQNWGQNRYNPITQDNFLKLYDIVRSKNITLICVQYPTRDIGPLRRIFRGEERVIFVDNKQIFLDALQEKGYATLFSDAFAGGFGHCTQEGNHLLASNIARVILKEYLGAKVPVDFNSSLDYEEDFVSSLTHPGD